MVNIRKYFLKFCNFISRPDVFFVLMFGLIILLIAGTIAQKNIGLYAAQTKYFSSFIVFAGDIIPFPGGYTIMTLIFLGLLSKTAFEKWKKSNIGTLIIHISVLMLLLGSFITSMFSYEGHMVIEEGNEASYISDYHKIELAVIKQTDDKEQVITFTDGWLKDGEVIKHKNLPFKIKVINFYRNTKVEKFINPKEINNLHVSSKNYHLNKLPILKESEMNQAGVILKINDGNGELTYTIFADMPLNPIVEINGDIFRLELRNKRTYLPFTLKLNSFNVKRYTGSSEAENYSSDVILKDGELAWRSVISMNEPLRYKGYTFFQSSFIEGAVDTTVLAVVNNVGRLFPYISSSLLCLGLLIHLFVRIPKLIRKNIIKLLMLSTLIVPNANATITDIDSFKSIPILENGRIKPLDSFARNQLMQFSGNKINASEWLAELIFDNEKSYGRHIFNIANPAVVRSLKLTVRDKHLYSFKEVVIATKNQLHNIKPIEQMPKENRTLEQQQLLNLYFNTVKYYEISRSLSFILPSFIIKTAENANTFNVTINDTLTYFDIRSYKNKIEAILSKNSLPVKAKVELQNIYQKIIQIEKDKQSQVLRIIPSTWGESNNWHSPWATFTTGQGSVQTAKYLNAWENLALAYLADENDIFKKISHDVYSKSLNLSKNYITEKKLNLEVSYNNWQPFKISLSLYITAFVLLLSSNLVLKHLLRGFAFTSLSIGVVIHTVGIITRMFIMARPPVTTLYESIIFVSLIAVVFALVFEHRKKDGTGIFIGATLGAILQFISMRYAAEGETMGMLSAVLNTNFWLATHVVTITIGYGCCLVAGILGHIYLVKCFINPNIKKPLDILNKNMLGAALIALFFSTLGTILGGIWADQSWGRFWGWDPKENGAMLICLWLIWLLHGRIAGTLKQLYFAAGIAFTNVMVALAWFGVNLLGVGLHSYGFTNNILLNLIIFCSAEALFIISMLYLNQLKVKK